MTHDELSKQLEGLWHDSFKAPGYKILRAIVELHRRGLNEGEYHCNECYSDYPCKTIRTIEKELG